MAESEAKRIGVSFDVKPHAYDPATQPEYFTGVLSRRVLAFVIDIVVIGLPVMFVSLFILVLGLLTLGLGWMMFWLLSPAAVIWAVIYYGWTLGSATSATIGMRAMGLEMRTWYGAPAYFLLGAVHAVAFWVSVSALTPLVLLVPVFNSRKRLLHDMLLGTVVVNNEARAQALRRPR
jgi:uncharacterized RDD family membrane protein YckC